MPFVCNLRIELICLPGQGTPDQLVRIVKQTEGPEEGCWLRLLSWGSYQFLWLLPRAFQGHKRKARLPRTVRWHLLRRPKMGLA